MATLDNWTNYALMLMSGDPQETPEASHAEEEADMLRRQREECQDMMAPAVGSVLDPLLAELAQAEIDVDESGVISFDEMQLGLQALDVRPRIQLSRQDFLELTRDGAMLGEYSFSDRALLILPGVDAHGCVSSEAFNQMIKSQICNYITRSLFRQGNLPQNERALSSVFAGGF